MKIHRFGKQKVYVIILAAGKATRLQPLSNRVPKPLIKICNRTSISSIILTFKKAGFSNFCVLIGYKGDLVKKEVMKIESVEVDFVEQVELTGMAEAVLLCLKFLKNQKKKFRCFFVTAADISISQESIQKMYNLYKSSRVDTILSLMKSKDLEIAKGHANVKISKNSSQWIQEENYGTIEIRDILEKPKISQIQSDYYSLPLYLFNLKIYEYLQTIKESKRGEKEIQDAIREGIHKGDKIVGIKVIQELITTENIGKYHLTNLKDILKMNLKCLKRFISRKSELNSKHIIEPVFLNSNIKIGNNVKLGPNVIINNNCVIGESCELSNAILYDFVKLGRQCKLNWCLIDANVQLPDKFEASNCFITNNGENNVNIIPF